MDCQLLDDDERLVAHPAGRMEASDGAALIARVQAALTDAAKPVVVDCTQLEFLNFGGIRALLRLGRLLAGQGGRLSFANARGQVAEALMLSGLSAIFSD